MAARLGANLRNYPTLYVSNIPWTMGQQELKEYFGKFSKVVRSHIIFDKTTGLHKGFGFVTLENKDCLQNILSKDKHMIDGKPVEVKLKELP